MKQNDKSNLTEEQRKFGEEVLKMLEEIFTDPALDDEPQKREKEIGKQIEKLSEKYNIE